MDIEGIRNKEQGTRKKEQGGLYMWIQTPTQNGRHDEVGVFQKQRG
jgi:hypothetical protein